MLTRIAIVIALFVAGCGTGHGETDHDVAVVTPNLFAGIPADTAFVLALREPLKPAVSERMGWDVVPFLRRMSTVAAGRFAAARSAEPATRLALALAAELPGPFDGHTRAVLYELRGLPVLRIEVADETALFALVERATARAGVRAITPSHWLANGEIAIALVRRGRQLAIAIGPADRARAIMPALAGEIPVAQRSLDPSTLPGFGGFLDLAALPRLLPPARDPCEEAVKAEMSKLALPRIIAEVRTFTADRFELVVRPTIDHPQVAATPSPPIPGIPATFPGRPIVAVSLASSGGQLPQAWYELMAVCEPQAALATMAAPTFSGGALAFYGAKLQGLIPTELEAYLAVTARDPDAITRSFAGAIASPYVAKVTDHAEVQRRGNTVVMSAGRAGTEHAKEALAATDPAPYFHVFVDVARIAAMDPPAGLSSPATSGIAYESEIGDALVRLIATLDLRIGNELDVTATLAPRIVLAASPVPDPARAASTACQRILDAVWASDARALARIGVTTGLDEIERRVRNGFETDRFVKSCNDLTPEKRACLLAAPDALQSDCNAFLTLPGLVDDFDHAVQIPEPAGAPAMAQLAGTWESTNGDRWTIDASGNATQGHGSGVQQRSTLSITGNGAVRQTYRDGGFTQLGVVVMGDELYLGSGGAYAMPTRDHFVLGYRDNVSEPPWIVCDHSDGFALDTHGKHSTTTCVFATEDGQTFLDADDRRYSIVGNYIVEPELFRAHYRRVRS